MMNNIFAFHNLQVCLLKTKIDVIQLQKHFWNLILLYNVLPKISRQIGFCNVTVIDMEDQNVDTIMKNIQNWYKLRTFPLYVGTVAIRIMSSLEHDMSQSVFKRHWHVRGIPVPFICADNKWKTYELSV